MGHTAKPLEFFSSPCAGSGDRRVGSFGKGFGIPDEMSGTGLSHSNPFAVEPVAIAYENARPVLNEVFESFPGAVLVDQEKGTELVGHHPEPTQSLSRSPGSLVDVVYSGGSDLAADFFAVGKAGFGASLYHLLNGPEAYVKSKNRETEFLDGGAGVAHRVAHLADECREPRTKSAAVLDGNGCLAHLPTLGAHAVVQHVVGDLK